MKVLVTGGSGFVGSYLIKELSTKHDAVNLDIVQNPGVEAPFIRCDVADKKNIGKLFKNELADVDAVIHLAGLFKTGAADHDADSYFRTNVYGMFNVLQACADAGISNFVFPSSYLVYGETGGKLANEAYAIKPAGMYAATKAIGETLCSSFSSLYGIRTKVLRKSCIYGNNDPKKRVVTIFIELAKSNKDISVFGNKILDLLHINDAVDAYMKAIEYNRSDVFNIGSGKGYNLKNVADFIVECFNSRSQVIEMPNRGAEPSHYIPDIRKAEKILKFKPHEDLFSFLESCK